MVASAARAPRALYVAALAAVSLYLAVELWLVKHLGFPLDDSWIHLQFARHLAAGDGLMYSEGLRVTGSTAPLWTAVLAVLLALPGNVVAWTKLVGAALYVLSVGATYRLARILGAGRGVAALAAAWTLAAYWLPWAALSGMEISLFNLLSLGAMSLHIAERRDSSRLPLALPLFALAALARPEGYLLLALAVVDRTLRARRQDGALRLSWSGAGLPRSLALAALVAVPVLLAYWWIGGSPLPTTFGAKAGAGRGLPDLQYVYTVFGILFRPLPFAALLAGGGVAVLVARWGEERDAGLLLALWTVGLPVAYSMLAPQGKHLLVGNFGRYFYPLLPCVAVLGALALERGAWHLDRVTVAGRRVPLRAMLVALLLAPTLATLAQGATRYAQNVLNVEDSDVRMAHLLRPRLAEEDVVAVQDIGALGFFLPNRLVDVSGIVSPEAQRLVRDATTPEDPFGTAGMRRFLDQTRPDYLVAYPAWYPALVQDGRFRPLLRVAIPDNITMAGDELILYSTPWTRRPLRSLSP